MATAKDHKTTKSTVKDVLFQKIGNKWFIFSEVNGDMVYSVMPEGMDPKSTKLELYNVIEDHMAKVASTQKRRHAEVAA